MKEESPISMIQVSPLLVESHTDNNGGNKRTIMRSTKLQSNQSLSSPVVKMSLCSMSLQVIWDDDPNLNNVSVSDDDLERSMNSHQFRVKEGTAFLSVDSDQNSGIVSKKNMIERINLVKDKLELVDRMDVDTKQTKKNKQSKLIVPFVNLPSQDPTNIHGIPCLIRVYSGLPQNNISSHSPIQSNINIRTQTYLDVNGALIHILPAVYTKAIDESYKLCCIEVQTQNQPILPHVPKRILKFPHFLENVLIGVCELNIVSC